MKMVSNQCNKSNSQVKVIYLVIGLISSEYLPKWPNKLINSILC
jgi:hypothetical protein